VQLARARDGKSRPLPGRQLSWSAVPGRHDLSDSQADSSSSELALSPRGRPLPFHLVRFAGCNYLRSELYGAITVAFGQQVVPGNQLLLWLGKYSEVP
jgi:hypothetical protein